MAQLDAVRAFAVAAVIVHHYIPQGWPYAAGAGVRLFFTLSGFLITGILLRSRDDAAERGSSRVGALGRFYARRCLRIFPLYYAVVIIAFVINLEPTRRLIGWLLTYTLNIYMASNGWFEIHFAHFWSLSVEEQFYISWPWIVLLIPRRWLLPAMLALVLTGPLYRWSYILSGYKNMTGLATYISTPSNLDTLGLGALLAMFVHRGLDTPAVRRGFYCIVLPLAICATAAVARLGSPDLYLVLHNPLQAIVFCCVILAASKGIGGPLGRILESKPLVYLGRISYGLYVYHPLMPVLGGFILFHLAGLTIPEKSWQMSILALALTFSIASLSWHWFEKPINDLKRYF
jgi:peptidoglycan/LPS O-acetylase OafA/YrhL